MEQTVPPPGARRAGCFSGIFHFPRRKKSSVVTPVVDESRPIATMSVVPDKAKPAAVDRVAPAPPSVNNKPTTLAVRVERAPDTPPPAEALATFAVLETERKKHSRSRGGGTGHGREELSRLFLKPYFGHFAGRWLTFDFRGNSGTSPQIVTVKVHVEGHDTQPLTSSTFYHSTRTSECAADSLRDRCIRFAHDVTPVRASASGHELHSPPSLLFLCEKKALMHMRELEVTRLPAKLQERLGRGTTQEVTVRVWPRSVCPAPIRLDVRPNILLLELQWMLCEHLPVTTPRFMTLYEKDCIDSLSPTSHLSSSQTQLECTLHPQAFQSKRELARRSSPITVSLIGHGVDEVDVHSNVTLYDFEQAVRRRFNLQPDSFLYLPQVFKSRRSYQSGLRMAAPLNSSTLTLIGRERRCPVIDGMPSLQVRETYEQLPLYQMTVGELDLLKGAPVVAFDVTGPTIPMNFKTIRTQGQCSDVHNTNQQRDEIFALVSVKCHAISVNPSWTTATLLKYIECISGFPAGKIHYNGQVLDNNSLVRSHFCRKWTTSNGGYLKLVSNIPEVVTT